MVEPNNSENEEKLKIIYIFSTLINWQPSVTSLQWWMEFLWSDRVGLKRMGRKMKGLELQSLQSNPTRPPLPKTFWISSISTLLHPLDHRQRWVQINNVDDGRIILIFMAINLGRPTTPTHNQLSSTATDTAARSGDEIFAGEELLELGIFDTVGVLGGGGGGGSGGEPVGSREAHHSVVSLDLAHATHSWGQRVVGGWSGVGNGDIFDAWPRT